MTLSSLLKASISALCVALPGISMAEAAQSVDSAVRSRRLLSNAAIAAHDAAGVQSFLEPDIKLIGSDGVMILGADAVRQAFEGRFADPTFVTFRRATDGVLADHDGARASERGHWTGLWRRKTGSTVLSGPYMAVWRKRDAVWRLESELYFLADKRETLAP